MPLRFSSSRSSRVKHSTGADPNRGTKARRGHPRPRYSTGEGTTITHFTGRETDRRALAKGTDVPADKAKEAPAMPRGR